MKTLMMLLKKKREIVLTKGYSTPFCLLSGGVIVCDSVWRGTYCVKLTECNVILSFWYDCVMSTCCTKSPLSDLCCNKPIFR